MASFGSRPAMEFSSSAASWTAEWTDVVERTGEGHQSVTRHPAVGWRHAHPPQKLAGWRMLPPVSEPSDTTAVPCATTVADPQDPPGTRSKATGLRTGPKAEFSFDEPMANSSQLVLPSTTPPAASSRSTAVAS